MNQRTLFLIVGLNALLLVGLVFVYPEAMIRPGNTIPAHADFENDCFACHTPFRGSSPDKCTSCHLVVEIGLKTTHGEAIKSENKNVAFHQELLEDDCLACHSEHKGVQPFRPISRFSHELLKSDTGQQCDNCHSAPDDSFHRLNTANCSQCHTQDEWASATFDHADFFEFDRDHKTECVTCHILNDYTAYTCYGCHEHSRSNIREEHVEEGIREFENCVDCHRNADEDEAEHLWRQRLDSDREDTRRSQDFNREHDEDD